MAPIPEPAWDTLRTDLRAFISRRVRNQADVEDLVQRVLLRIVSGLSTLRDGAHFHAWAYQIARHAIVDHHRSGPVRREVARGDALDLDTIEPAARAPAPMPGDVTPESAQLATCLPSLLEALRPTERDAIKLVELDGLTQSSAANMAGVSVSGMKSRVQRGRQHLRALLEDCCRIQLDRRGSVVDYTRRDAGPCGPCL